MYGRWQDWLILVYGIWLIISPAVTGYASVDGGAAWNSYLTGAVLLVMARFALLDLDLWEEIVNVGVGTWLYFSPFIVDFYGWNAATINQMVLGVLVFLTAVWAVGRSDEHPEPIEEAFRTTAGEKKFVREF